MLTFRADLYLRNRLPRSVQHLLRLVRHVVPQGRAAAQIPGELLADCKVCASRQELVTKFPNGARVAEVGTFRGNFARHILYACAPSELHVIDLDLSQLDPEVAGHDRVRVHHGASHTVLAGFPDAYFDWIYIDADHSYAGVLRDADAAATKVKPGGFLVFNDFAHADAFLGTYGVQRAVADFVVANRWPVAWLAYDVNALYDIALKRPGGPEGIK
jgi:SAM-dependent methyltransferase